MAGFKNISDDSAPLSEINITPLVDVMLVLLVIFMITAPMLESGIAVQLPKASGKALPKPENPITLSLTKDSKILLGKEEIPLENLTRRIFALGVNKESREVFIRADETLPYGFVAKIMAIVKDAGVNKIGLVTLPPVESTASPSKNQ